MVTPTLRPPRVPIVIRVRPDALARLDKLAAAQDMTRSALCRRLLVEGITRLEAHRG